MTEQSSNRPSSSFTVSVDEAKALKANLERTITEALNQFSTQTGLKVDAVDVTCVESLGLPSVYLVSVEAILPS